MSCEAVNEIVMASRSDWHLLEPASTPGPCAAVSLMRRRCADFHRGPGQIMPYYRPDVWQQPDPPSPPSTSLALGSGPCMALLRRIFARRQRTASREHRLESE